MTEPRASLNPAWTDRLFGPHARCGMMLWVLVGAYVIAGAWNLHLQGISNPDEPRYAVPAREMLRTGDWLIPHFNARERLNKPILFYWIIAATGAVGQAVGLGLATAMRVGPLLMGLGAVLGTFVLGKRLVNARCGFFAGGMLMTAKFFHEVSRDLVIDMTLTATLLWAWVFWHIAHERIVKSERAFWPLVGFYVFLGLASLAKGPHMPVLFVLLPLVVYLAWSGRLRDLLRAGLRWGLPLAITVGLFWYILLMMRGIDVWLMAKTEIFGRALGKKDHQKPIPFVFYFVRLGELFMPWVLLIPVIGWLAGKREDASKVSGGWRARLKAISDPAKLLICALAIPFFFLGIALTKRPLYILPLFPYLALGVAWAWERLFLIKEGESAGINGPKLVLALSMIVLILATYAGFQADRWGGTMPEIVALAIIAFLLALSLRKASQDLTAGLRHAASLRLLLAAVLLSIGFEAVARPVMERAANREAFFDEVSRHIGQRPVVFHGTSSNEAVWYLDRPGEFVDDINRPTTERTPGMRERFFEAPNVLMIARLRSLQREPSLLPHVRILVSDLPLYENEEYVIVEPDPDFPPNPEIFKPATVDRADREPTDSED